MIPAGQILLADDEDTFLQSVSHLLQNRGYECQCVSDASMASEVLQHQGFDVLIADIRMPGNPELEWIKSVRQDRPDLPVIIVTGYPTLQTAIDSIQLQVYSYLVKPIDFEQLLEQVKSAVAHRRIQATVIGLQERVSSWNQDLKQLEESAGSGSSIRPGVSINTFVDTTLHNIVGCLADIKHLTEAMENEKTEPDACKLLNCPRPAVLIGAIREAIQVLEETKTAFKSRQLKRLREDLVAVVEGWPEN